MKLDDNVLEKLADLFVEDKALHENYTFEEFLNERSRENERTRTY